VTNETDTQYDELASNPAEEIMTTPGDMARENAERKEEAAPDLPSPEKANRVPAMESRNMSVYYGNFKAVEGVNLPFEFNEISALIGPSGCGKSTVLRSLNRMNDLIPTAESRAR